MNNFERGGAVTNLNALSDDCFISLTDRSRPLALLLYFYGILQVGESRYAS